MESRDKLGVTGSLDCASVLPPAGGDHGGAGPEVAGAQPHRLLHHGGGGGREAAD